MEKNLRLAGITLTGWNPTRRWDPLCWRSRSEIVFQTSIPVLVEMLPTEVR
jgi:hypothetical protein